MNTIEELIQKECPEGVKFKELETIGEFISGLSGKSKDDFVNGNAKFITYMNVYSNPALNLEVEDKVKINEGEKQNLIEKGDILFTGSSETPDECGMSSVVLDEVTEPTYLNSFCFGFRLFSKSNFDFGYLKHLFRGKTLRALIAKTANGVTRYNVSKKLFAKIEIPVPPLSVQHKIVEILDKFTSLEAELEAELEARKKQYEYYRNQLLDFTGREDVEITKLGDLVLFRNGKGHEKIISQDGNFIVVNSKFISTGGKVVKYCSEQIVPLYKDDILMVMSDLPDGKALAKCFRVDQDNLYTLNQRIGAFTNIKSKRITTLFLKYQLDRNKQLLKFDNGVDQTNLRKDDILNILIYIPPLSEQHRIVTILDKFEALINGQTASLSAEIKARHQQYEYYRDKLLSFKRKD